jgi:hypothetical protein
MRIIVILASVEVLFWLRTNDGKRGTVNLQIQKRTDIASEVNG